MWKKQNPACEEDEESEFHVERAESSIVNEIPRTRIHVTQTTFIITLSIYLFKKVRKKSSMTKSIISEAKYFKVFCL